MSKHTPGPWEYDGKFQVCIPHKDGLACFRVPSEDARLIVLAPELLDICYQAERIITANGTISDEDLIRGEPALHGLVLKLRKLIAKAEGQGG